MIVEHDGTSIGGAEVGLTAREARELIGYLEQMLQSKPGRANHSHLSSDDYQTELAIWIVNPGEEPYWERQS